jgi:hypothetical protein
MRQPVPPPQPAQGLCQADGRRNTRQRQRGRFDQERPSVAAVLRLLQYVGLVPLRSAAADTQAQHLRHDERTGSLSYRARTHQAASRGPPRLRLRPDRDRCLHLPALRVRLDLVRDPERRQCWARAGPHRARVQRHPRRVVGTLESAGGRRLPHEGHVVLPDRLPAGPGLHTPLCMWVEPLRQQRH